MYTFFTNDKYAEDLISIFNKIKADLNPLYVLYK
jgi:hypothetical protein